MRPEGWHKTGRKVLGLTLALAGLIALWALGAALIARPFLPSPAKAFRALAAMGSSGLLWTHGSASAARVLWALLWSFPPAAALGLAAGRSARLDAIVSPLLYLLHPLPKAAFLPVIMLLMGLGEASKIFLLGIIVFSQIIVAARDSSRRIQRQLLDSVRSLGGTGLDLARHVIVPAALPELLTALRVSLGTAVAVLFLSETFATQTGLGWLIVDAWARVSYPEMYAGILALSGLGLGLFMAVDLAERLLCPWRDYRS